MVSEYPVVDGKLSIKCYFTALDKCYQLYKDSFNRKFKSSYSKPSLEDFDYMIFHTPFCKIVQKSFGRLMLHDLMSFRDEIDGDAKEKYRELLQYK